MKINWNSKYLTIAAYAVGTIVISALAIMLIFNFETVEQKLSAVTVVTTPIIIGIFCAYLLNPLMMKFENGFLKKWAKSDDPKARARARAVSVTLTMLAVLAALALIILLVIPQLITNLATVFSNMDSYIATARNFISKISEDYPQLAEFLGNPVDDFSNFFSGIWNRYSNELLGFAGNIASGIWAVVDTLKNVFFGLTLSIYLLAKKEMFVGQSKKLIFAFLRADHAQRLLGICRKASEKFLGSIIGKIIDSAVIAMLIFVGCVIAGLPYAPLMSVILFVFQLIPVVGAIIGCVPCCLLLLLAGNPIQAVWFVVIVMIMQTIDGNFIGPWILGDSTGLPAVWILISIIIGGGFFGMLGMLLAVPVFAVIYMLFKDFVEYRLRKRHLPQDTDNYVGNVDYITPDYVYEEPLPSEKKPAPEKLGFIARIKRKLSEKNKKS